VRERIDFFVNVSPEIAILDVPFLVLVWDLRHCLQPFFPEVGSGDEWQRRENFFSQVLKRAAYVVTATDTGKKEVQMFYGIPDERIRILPHPTPRFALEDGAGKTRRCWPNSDCRPITSFIRRSFGAIRITCASYARSCTSNRSTICACPLSSPVPIKGTKVIYPATGANAAAGRSGIFSRPRLASGFAGLVSKRFRSLLSEFFRTPEFTAVGSIRIGVVL